MKRMILLFLLFLLFLPLSASGGKETASMAKRVDELSITFVPSSDVDDIIVRTKPLGNLLTEKLEEEGWTVGSVRIAVSTSYEAAGEALDAGTTDIAFIPAGTYVKYEDGAEVILTALRKGKSIESTDPTVWNGNKPTSDSDTLTAGYRALIYAGVTGKGRKIAEKVNSGETPTWEELDSCSWGVGSTTSSAGYIYPSIWLYERYGKTVKDLSKAVQTNYASAFAGLSSGMYDIICCYADGRQEYEEKWTGEWGRKASIWDETDVIGVTDMIMNDTISVSRNSENMQQREFVEAVKNAFIAIAETEEGREALRIYKHEGYVEADDSDYDAARTAEKLFTL